MDNSLLMNKKKEEEQRSEKMESIDKVLRMKSLDKLDKEMKQRQNIVGYSMLRTGMWCECDECTRLRAEIKKIQQRIKVLQG